MHRRLKSLSPMLWVVALALLVVQASDAHMHLCFDGQEPRSSLHMSSDRTAVCHEGDDYADGTHQDQDVDAIGAALAKKEAPIHVLGPLFVASFVLPIMPPQRGVPQEVTEQNPTPKLPYLFLPLLRGPPA
jgi:hypothetical protein